MATTFTVSPQSNKSEVFNILQPHIKPNALNKINANYNIVENILSTLANLKPKKLNEVIAQKLNDRLSQAVQRINDNLVGAQLKTSIKNTALCIGTYQE